MKKLLALLLALSLLCTACADKNSPVNAPENFESSVAFTADIHYVAQDDPQTSLVVRKMIYNREIISSLLFDCQKNKTDTLLILGDLTNTGRKSEHTGLIAELEKAKENGLDIYVLPGGYDFGEVTVEEFTSLYADFGYNKALSKDTSSSSYSAIIKDKLVLMLDTNVPKGEYSGAITPSTLVWLEQQLIYAEEKGLSVITASHNTLVNYAPEGLVNPYEMGNGDQLVEMLNRYNVKLHLSGFRHSRQVNSFGSGYEIMIDMPIFYPNCYGMLYFTGDKLDFVPHQIDVTAYAKKAKIDDTNLKDFKAFSKRVFTSTTRQNAEGELFQKELSAVEQEEAQKTYMAAEAGRANGNLYKTNTALLQSEGYKVWQNQLATSRFGRWMPVWLTKCNEKTVGFSTEF